MGRKVVVTRAPEQSGALVQLLAARGARPISLPTITLLDADPAELDARLADVETYDLVVLTSVNAAVRLFDRLGAPERVRAWAAVGAKTASWLAARVPGPVLVPEAYRGEALAEAVVQALGDGTDAAGPLRGRRILLPEGAHARGVVGEGLEAAGAELDRVVVYRLEPVRPLDPAAIEGAEAFTFLSGRTLEAFLDGLPPGVGAAALAGARVAMIGPVAAATAAERGVRVDVVPRVATAEALVDALEAAFG
jgi:uroporphyrinogen-III synthase